MYAIRVVNVDTMVQHFCCVRCVLQTRFFVYGYKNNVTEFPLLLCLS